ncbi:uncharacterized protein LOC143298839 isoform X2 [Babylonia areolata]|uniref:uncharacterized protein LOC143298839 isoform X2 n=1 Tax=Babylonia areolata TaxID=304850 RepID=UPI003FCF1949
MEQSFRIDTAPPNTLLSADLDSTWLGGEVSQSKVKPLPLNTARLKHFRQLSILETGHVSVEVVRRRGDQERLAELYVISGDGQEICVEQWKVDGVGTGDDLSAHTGCGDRTWKTFTYTTLPEKYWRKYAHARRFVDLVKSKTPKVTMYSDRAKGVLMENWPPNFEATFFLGPRITLCGSEVHIQEESGASLFFQRDSLHTLVNPYTLDLVQHAVMMREQCVRLEASVMTVQAMSPASEALFPVTVGMRPSNSFCSSTSSTSGSMDLLSSPRFPRPPSPPSPPPPSSPGPLLDLRHVDLDSRRHTPTSTSTPTSQHSPLDCKTSQSPLRHISTLEGRKIRRQLSDSTDSSEIHHGQPPLSAAQPSPDLGHASRPCCVHSTEHHPTHRGLTDSRSSVTAQCPLEARTSPQQFVRGQQGFVLPPVTSPCPVYNSSPRKPTACGTMGHTPFSPGTVEQGTPLPKESVSGGLGKESEVGGNRATSGVTSDMTSVCAGEVVGEEEEEGGRSAVVRQTFVAYTGWASQLASGAIWIHYNEGTQLGVFRDQPLVLYVDQQGVRHRYLRSDDIPEVVRQKLEKLPTVLESLKRRGSASTHSLAST